MYIFWHDAQLLNQLGIVFFVLDFILLAEVIISMDVFHDRPDVVLTARFSIQAIHQVELANVV